MQLRQLRQVLDNTHAKNNEVKEQRAAFETDALRCANALGKHWIERSTRTVHHRLPVS
jgi:hypothetical protein